MKIRTMAGPEDMVLDVYQDFPRLIVSCSKRRDRDTIAGAPDDCIGYLNLQNEQFKVFEITGQPRNIILKPHGLDLVRFDDGLYLYVISHAGVEAGSKHVIIKYRVFEERLEFAGYYSDVSLISPNDITVLPDGSFYVTNDSTKKGFIKFVDYLVNLRSANVVYYDKTGWRVVAGNLSFANGIAHRNNKVYVTCVRSDKLHVYHVQDSGSLMPYEYITAGTGLDNISFVSDTVLVVPAHTNLFKFSLHSKGLSASPTAVYEIDLAGKTSKIIYENGGEKISAGSTAIVFNDQLYISQVFEGYILKTARNT